ncbi:uncharacterized protein EHS24_001664 [Apiotrichum porosum]|uniref:CULT domain-containing protein n=1 Tax=Apiotrichum porosum TaxID=105984 RepID=A0A427XIW0_9TREE|nr:uncharacterized protein EHS24_001664 [Apiotrichum porosum]RSH78758.1 hypothetical protein EHS24_001664 [Apiotrichum porosum]
MTTTPKLPTPETLRNLPWPESLWVCPVDSQTKLVRHRYHEPCSDLFWAFALCRHCGADLSWWYGVRRWAHSDVQPEDAVVWYDVRARNEAAASAAP